MKTYIFSLIFIAITLNSAISQTDRNVIWVHGLGGGEFSWFTNSNFHQGRYKMKSITPTYTAGNLSTCAETIKGKIKQELGDAGAVANKNMAVCHSLGGLVSRTLDMKNGKGNESQNFGGFITVHSPNKGATFADNVANGSVEKVFLNMHNKLKGPFQKQFTGTLKVIHFFHAILPDDIHDIIDKILDFLDNSGSEDFGLITNLVNELGWTDPEKLKDLNTKSKAIQDLKDYQTGLQRISMWGGEESNIFFRLMSSNLNKPGRKALDIVSDQDVEPVMNTVKGVYRTFQDINKALDLAAIFSPFPDPYEERVAAWREGADYIGGPMETDYLMMIGAIQWKHKTTNVQVLTPECNNRVNQLRELLKNFYATDEFQNREDILDALEELHSNPNCYTIGQQTTYEMVRVPNDGVVLVDSQNDSGINFENINCNHFEAVNTKVLSLNLERIIRDGAGGSFFMTPVR